MMSHILEPAPLPSPHTSKAFSDIEHSRLVRFSSSDLSGTLWFSCSLVSFCTGQALLTYTGISQVF